MVGIQRILTAVLQFVNPIQQESIVQIHFLTHHGFLPEHYLNQLYVGRTLQEYTAYPNQEHLTIRNVNWISNINVCQSVIMSRNRGGRPGIRQNSVGWILREHTA